LNEGKKPSMKFLNSMNCKNLNEGKNLFNEIQKNSMKCKNLNEGKNLLNEIQEFNEMQELSEGKKPF